MGLRLVVQFVLAAPAGQSKLTVASVGGFLSRLPIFGKQIIPGGPLLSLIQRSHCFRLASKTKPLCQRAAWHAGDCAMAGRSNSSRSGTPPLASHWSTSSTSSAAARADKLESQPAAVIAADTPQ